VPFHPPRAGAAQGNYREIARLAEEPDGTVILDVPARSKQDSSHSEFAAALFAEGAHLRAVDGLAL
jgi:hypothetical protein